ncbi:hypothetical protein ACE1SV_65730 [Streptomyces sennicomposti]
MAEGLAADRPFRWGEGGWRQADLARGPGGIAAAIALSLWTAAPTHLVKPRPACRVAAGRW